MLKKLFIFDVMPFMHAGHVNHYSFFESLVDVGSTWKVQRTPAGGISLLLNSIRDVINQGDVVFCSDRRPTIKQDMYTGYKANRQHNEGVAVERGVAEYILEKCGCTIFARAGYEADDIIYTLVKRCHESYDEIYIYTGDSDMFFLVDEKVSIRPANSKGRTVTRANFESLNIHGARYRYNTITLNKILHGDTSDNVPALPLEIQHKVTAFLNNDAVFPMLGDKSLMMYYANMAFPEAIPQIDLIFPLEVDDIHTDFAKPNWEMMCLFGNAMHNKNFRNYTRPDFDIQLYVTEMQERGLYVEEVN